LIFFAMLSPSTPLPSSEDFFAAQWFVLIQQKKQMNMVSVLQIQMHIPIAAALAFSSSRVRGASFAYSA
jgi:hypothetical protein